MTVSGWAGVCLGVCLAAGAGGQALTRAEAESMAAKLSAIADRGAVPTPPDRERVRTSFTDREVNAYFRYIAADQMPEGLVNPQIVIHDGGRVEGRGYVDLDAVRESRERSMLDPMAYVSGMMEVHLVATLTTSETMGRFTLESATLGGVRVPRGLVEELVRYYTRTPEDPDGFDIDEPFVLPSGIREVLTRGGSATVVQ